MKGRCFFAGRPLSKTHPSIPRLLPIPKMFHVEHPTLRDEIRQPDLPTPEMFHVEHSSKPQAPQRSISKMLKACPTVRSAAVSQSIRPDRLLLGVPRLRGPVRAARSNRQKAELRTGSWKVSAGLVLVTRCGGCSAHSRAPTNNFRLLGGHNHAFHPS